MQATVTSARSPFVSRMLLRIGIGLRIRGLLLTEHAYIQRRYGTTHGISPLAILRYPAATEAPLRIGRFLDPRNETYLIDVGANNGEWAERFKSMFPKTHLELWEPNSDLMQTARQRFNQHDGLTTFEAAASRASGTAEFSIPTAAAMGTLHPYTSVVSCTAAHGAPTTMSVSLRALDSVSRRVAGRQVVLKIDVQGHECEVLEGARETLQHVDVAISETTLVPIYEGRMPTFARVVRAMEDAGLYPCMFPSAGVIAGSHPCEQDVLFVREGLLTNALQ